MSTSTELGNEVVYATESGNPILTHIIDRGDDRRPAAAIVLEARVNGTPITALCGHTWVPERDPMKYPPCDACVEMFEFARDIRGV
jgi:hypothetical protein